MENPSVKSSLNNKILDMKKVLFIICVVLSKLTYSQNNEGSVDFDIINIDTTTNTSVSLTDSVKYIYSFKENNTSLRFGTEYSNETVLVNDAGSFFLNTNSQQRTYSMTNLSISLDSLKYAYDTTGFKFILTSDYKIIAGYNCRKIIVNCFIEQNNENIFSTQYLIWFTDEIKGSNYLPLFIGDYPCTNGLILEYQYPKENGYTLLTPKSVSIQPIPNAVFHPDFTEYTLIHSSN